MSDLYGLGVLVLSIWAIWAQYRVGRAVKLYGWRFADDMRDDDA